jgi:mRNA interferase MazF
MARLRRGEVRWYRFQRPDKKRPVVILTRNSALEFLGEVTIAPITSTVREIPSEVLLTKEDGMARDCAVNLDHLQTVARAKLGPLVTTLGRDKLDRIAKAVSFALDLTRSSPS